MLFHPPLVLLKQKVPDTVFQDFRCLEEAGADGLGFGALSGDHTLLL